MWKLALWSMDISKVSNIPKLKYFKTYKNPIRLLNKVLNLLKQQMRPTRDIFYNIQDFTY